MPPRPHSTGGRETPDTPPLQKLNSKSSIAVVLGLFALFAGLVIVDRSEPPQWLLFLGSFHVLLIHFPIALLLLTLAAEVASRFLDDSRALQRAATLILFVAAGSAVLAAGAGFLFSLQGGYQDRLLSWHKWLGLSVTAGAVAALVLRDASAKLERRGSKAIERAYLAVLTITVVGVATAAHLGASLSHGTGYFSRHMPPVLRSMMGISATGGSAVQIVDLDSAVIFKDLVEPVLQRRCVTCHGESKQQGSLRLDSAEGIGHGGESGRLVVAGKPDQSEIVRRTTLPLYDKERMPPDGEEPLLVAETEIIRWWIAEGASFERTVAETASVPPPVQTVLNRLSGPPEERKRGVYALEIAAPDPAVVDRVQKKLGIELRVIAEGLPLLEANVSRRKNPVRPADVEQMRPLFPQIAWLDLAYSRLDRGVLPLLAEMPHLSRLYLQGTNITDEDLSKLGSLKFLEHLNLYGTPVTDKGLKYLAELPNLQSLYLWQTRVTEEAASKLQQGLPQLVVNLGAAPPPSSPEGSEE
ncbi:MAG: hypothetical protein GEU99_03275 [Luteitalea sp.]|nr:hypothetical protein [Luteitalea sp.]